MSPPTKTVTTYVSDTDRQVMATLLLNTAISLLRPDGRSNIATATVAARSRSSLQHDDSADHLRDIAAPNRPRHPYRGLCLAERQPAGSYTIRGGVSDLSMEYQAPSFLIGRIRR